MVKPHPSKPDFAPIPEEDLSYSGLIVIAFVLAFVPMMLIWAALVLLSLPLKAWNLLRRRRGKEQFHRLNAFICEFFVLLRLIFLYPFAKKYQFTPGKGRPILLVHGYLHNASAWHALIDRLKKENLGPIYAINLGNGTVSGKFWSIKQYAEQVLEKTVQIAKETGRKEIAIIAHSMGGLVTAAYAKLAPQDASIDIITLGSPLDGAPLANHLATGPNGRSMIANSRFLTDLRQGMEKNEDHIQFRHIAAKQDWIVPEESALMGSNPENNVSFDDIGHSGLTTSPLVADQICKWLKN